MKATKTAQNATPEIEVYRDFMRLDREPRRRIALRILRDQRILADLYDHLLIQRSLDERGASVTWESCKRGNGSRP
jgi:hypothetical protein